jgi:two-component system, NtrC family, response regulator HydG
MAVTPFVSTRAPSRRLRDRDQRSGVADVLQAVTAEFVSRPSRPLRGSLEDALRKVLRRDAVRLDTSSLRAVTGATLVRDDGSVAVPLPGGGGVLSAEAARQHGIDGWDLQVLEAGANLAALVLQIDRDRGHVVRRPTPPEMAELVGSSSAMEALRQRIDRVAGSEFAVLIEGESGVGKELVARQIHEASRRARGPFVALNCAALVETLVEAELFGIEDRTATGVKGRRGKFEQADGGTLFLDEIADLSATAQAKLLRVLQDMSIDRVGGHTSHRVNVRVVAATNRSLDGLVQSGRFRPDLFYRLNSIDIRVPPLRAHRADIPELVDTFLARHRDFRALSLSPSAKEALMTYDWPGNVRELERVIERAVALAEGDVIGLADLPAPVTRRHLDVIQPALEAGDTLRAWASRYARVVLSRCGNNKREACQWLGISYHTLQAHLRFGQPPRGGPRGVPSEAGHTEAVVPGSGGEGPAAAVPTSQR